MELTNCCKNMEVMHRDKLVVLKDKIPFSDEINGPHAYLTTERGMYRIKYCPVCAKEIEIK